MSIKVGINGFGRIGRMVMRCCMNHPNIEIVGINDLCPADYLAYMLKFDTMHGRFQGEVSADGTNIVVNGRAIPVFAERDPANLPWAKVGAEYVIESTGLFLTKEKAAGHIAAGAKHVVMSAPSKDDTPMFVMVVRPYVFYRTSMLNAHQKIAPRCGAILYDPIRPCRRSRGRRAACGGRAP